jgi:hypothetical protein
VAIGGAWRHSQVPSSGRAEDVIDLAVLALPDYQVDSLGAQFLTLGETDPEHQPDPTPISGTYYLVVGFPASRQSTWLREGTLLPRQIYLTLKPGPEAGTIHPNYRSDWNLTLDFDKEQGAGSGGRKQAMPDPVGMSGGGIWAANGLLGPDPRAERLVAIATTWHRNANVIIGTRIGLCFDAIAHLVPAIGHLLPWPRA